MTGELKSIYINLFRQEMDSYLEQNEHYPKGYMSRKLLRELN